MLMAENKKADARLFPSQNLFFDDKPLPSLGHS
jgi:hypothetical protein